VGLAANQSRLLADEEGRLVLTLARPTRGFSFIELMVVIAVIGVMLALGVPGIASWAGDARLRSVAESFTNGVRLAQATAIARSRVAVFAVTGANPAYNATPAVDGTNWMVLLDPLSSSEPMGATYLIQSSTEARQHGVSVNSNSNAMVCFNSFGQQTANLTASLPSASVTCATPGGSTGLDTSPTVFELSRTGSSRRYQVLVYPGGRVRMCDKAKTLSTTNPDGCP
jgi:type IV fimbrial biogenesis protein FimT